MKVASGSYECCRNITQTIRSPEAVTLCLNKLMKDYRFLLLAAFLLFGEYRYTIQPRVIKSEFPSHPVGHSPVLVLRLFGLLLLGAAILFVVMFVRHQAGTPHVRVQN